MRVWSWRVGIGVALLSCATAAIAADEAAAPFARREKLALKRAVASDAKVPRYGRLELTLDLAASFDNPFDARDGKPIPTIRDAEATVCGLPQGRYGVQWWDTWKGEVMRSEQAECAGGSLRLKLSELQTDVAARIVGE